MGHKVYMERALRLAEKGKGWTNPNPMVGAVIVKDKQIIGEGYHKKNGSLHAERNALNQCTQSPEGATMYITLEPCCHHGKTPPCTNAIIDSGIENVVIATLDPHSVVAGKGVEQLRAHGIQVDIGVMESESKELNYIFNYFIRQRIPYVLLKYAMTLDGKIATHTGGSKWITNENSRNHVHHTRHEYTGIMVGVNTVLQDDPSLTARIDDGHDPIRIVCDTQLRIPLDSQIVRTASSTPTIVATASNESGKISILENEGIQILKVPLVSHQIDLNYLMVQLGERQIDSILLEGGATMNWSALHSKIVNRVQAFIAPKIFGGDQAKTPIGGLGMESAANAFQINPTAIKRFDKDYLIEGEVIY